MWLSRLDLLAFGRFTDVRLPLGPGFHLIYGPNEAGKSTTLRAIRQLLFGFDERTTDNFTHANPNLRVGGIILGDSGLEIEVIRRKARKDSLRGTDELSIIDQEQWQSFLCGVDEETFSHRYGIDYEQLVKGGHEIATGSGDLGEILFATGSGVMDLTALQKQLTDEAAELFKPQGKKQRLNQAIVDWQQQRENVLAKLLSVSEWEETNRQRDEIQVRLEQVSQDWTLRTNEIDRLRRWQQALPLAREADSLQSQLEPLETACQLPAEFGAMRQEAILLFKHAESQEQTASEALRQTQQEFEKISIPERFLSRVDDLNHLFSEWGSYRKAQLDRPLIVAQQCDHKSKLNELLAGIGCSLEELSIWKVNLDRTQRTRVSQLERQHAGYEQTLQQADVRSGRLRQRITQIQTELAAMPIGRPVDELRTIVRQARSEGNLEARLESLRDEISTLQHEADLQLEQMGLWTGSLEDLRSLRVPPVAMIKKWEAVFDANQADRSLLRSRQAEFDAEYLLLNQQIEKLRHEFQVPTEQDLEISRKNRDAIWGQIRDAILSNKLPDGSLIESFERSVGEADRLVDRLRNEADRVAQMSEQLAEFQSLEIRKLEIGEQLEKLEDSRQELERKWQAEWPELRSTPLSPREMQTWTTRREILLQNDVLISRRKSEAQEIYDRINEILVQLRNQLVVHSQNGDAQTLERALIQPVASGTNATTTERPNFRQQLSFGWEHDPTNVPTANANSATEQPLIQMNSLNEWLSYADERLERDETNQRRRVDAEDTLAKLRIEESEVLDQKKLAERELLEWQSVWRSTMVDLNLAPDSSPDVAVAYLDSIVDLMEHHRQVEQFQSRIDGIDADARQFENGLKALCQEIAPDVADLTIDDAISSLRNRLSVSLRDQARWNEQSAKKTHSEQQLKLARESRTRGEEIVVELCRIAGIIRPRHECETTTEPLIQDALFQELASVEEQSRRRSLLEMERNRVIGRLHELAKDQPLDEFLDQVRSQSSDDIGLRLADLDHESSQLATERDRLNHQLGGYDEQLKRMDGGAGAAEAEEKQRQCLAQIRSDAEQYVRFKLASSVLHSAIERYREKIRGPVLSVASEIFRELTLNSFDGLRVDEDDQNKPILVGVRSGGKEGVCVSGMSEGTCDQLYLALRIASLRLESAPRSQLPFIVDDILIQFDDSRAAAALRVLSRLGKQRQVIFFTHHEHLLEIASKHLPGEYSAQRLVI